MDDATKRYIKDLVWNANKIDCEIEKLLKEKHEIMLELDKLKTGGCR